MYVDEISINNCIQSSGNPLGNFIYIFYYLKAYIGWTLPNRLSSFMSGSRIKNIILPWNNADHLSIHCVCSQETLFGDSPMTTPLVCTHNGEGVRPIENFGFLGENANIWKYQLSNLSIQLQMALQNQQKT